LGNNRMTAYNQISNQLRSAPCVWLVTGVAGFIGSNLLESLLKLDQRVVGLDNFSTGHRRNLDEVRELVSAQQWGRFEFQEGDIADLAACRRAVAGVDLILHQAALGSVPLSMSDPLGCHRANVTGFLNLLVAGRDAAVKRLVYASSSAVYGNDPEVSKVEEKIDRPLSPYAASKRMNEVYADAFATSYGFESIGLRYFNVYGPRQDPEGAYAAVIPKWIAALLRREPVFINGDGETSRDFCFIANVVQANLLAATTADPAAVNRVFNIALGGRTTLNQLFATLQTQLRQADPSLPDAAPIYRDFRAGDIRHSLADVRAAQQLLGYEPTHNLAQGLELAMAWYRRNAG
jgi:UDP-N-acetylglucosamine/UDP-N-acetylgalactosamine 4-epimerase